MTADPRRSRMALTASVSVGVAIFFCLYSLIPVVWADELGPSSWAMGIMMAVVMAVQVFTPLLVRRFSLRSVLIVSLSVLATGALVIGSAESPAALLLGAAASGAGFGVLIVAGAQGVALVASEAERARALGSYGFATVATTAVVAPAGVQLTLGVSPSAFGWCALTVGFVAAGIVVRIPGDLGRMPNRPAQSVPGVCARTRSISRVRIGVRRVFGTLPWLVAMLLVAVVLLFSYGLSALPLLGTERGLSAALIVFSVQAANALGRGLGGELASTLPMRWAVNSGAVLLVAGGVLVVVGRGSAPMVGSAVLIGLGVGIVQTLALHTMMQRMGAGAASVCWNLAVDGALWSGGVLWGLCLASGSADTAVVALATLVAVLSLVRLLRGCTR